MKKTLITLLSLGCVAMADSLTLSTTPEYNGTEGGGYCGVVFTLGADDAERFTLSAGELGSQVTLATISLTERGNKDLESDRVLYITDSNNTYLGSSAVFTKTEGSDVAVFNFGDALTLNTGDTYYAYMTTSGSVASWVAGETTVPGGQYYSGQLAASGGSLTGTTATNWGLLNGQKNAASTTFAPVMSIVVNPVASANIPEPATATLSLLALAGLAARRRRH